MSDKTFSYWDGQVGPDGDVSRSGRVETPEWYQRMVIEFENERQAYLNTKVILTDLILEMRATSAMWECCPTLFAVMADRAEARLREVTGDE